MSGSQLSFFKNGDNPANLSPNQFIKYNSKLYASHHSVKLMDWINRENYSVEQDGLSDQGNILTFPKKSPGRIPCIAFIYLKAPSDTIPCYLL